jgi:tRNA (guanine-N7-)-methyltransferase
LQSNIPKEKNRLYGRKQTRPLSDIKQAVTDSLLARLQPDIEATKAKKRITIDELFGKAVEPVWFEIGFGSGEHLIGLMKQHPDTYMIGAEPFINGMANFLHAFDSAGLPDDKVRVWMDDAILLAERLPDRSLERIYVLNPDPWPKKRHHKRRIINQENLTTFARLLKPGGILVMSTDVSDLADWMVTEASLHPDFEWTAKEADDWRVMPADWIPTRYEGKGKAKGRQQVYLMFVRKFY